MLHNKHIRSSRSELPVAYAQTNKPHKIVFLYRRNIPQLCVRTLGACGVAFALGVIFFHTEDNWHTAWNRINTINFSVTVFSLFSGA